MTSFDPLEDFILRWRSAFGESLTREQATERSASEHELYEWLKRERGGDEKS